MKLEVVFDRVERGAEGNDRLVLRVVHPNRPDSASEPAAHGAEPMGWPVSPVEEIALPLDASSNASDYELGDKLLLSVEKRPEPRKRSRSK